MKRMMAVAALGLFAIAPATYAEGTAAFRIGPTIGSYKIDLTATQFPSGGGQVPQPGFSGDNQFSYGLTSGFQYAYAGLFADLGLELLQINESDSNSNDDFKRTDMLLSAGYRFADHYSVYGGYRWGQQSQDKFFDDEFLKDSGPLVGAAINFPVGNAATFGASLAYCFNKVDGDSINSSEDLDYGGISARLSLTFAGAHSLQLRYQRFSGDISFPDGGGGRVDVNLQEQYLNLYYVYNLVI
ncbi:MAG TPA: hypothetical protein VM074_04460 [Solimonas sp.]|nr:hypothetical protein [Solimonas sp.]